MDLVTAVGIGILVGGAAALRGFIRRARKTKDQTVAQNGKTFDEESCRITFEPPFFWDLEIVREPISPHSIDTGDGIFDRVFNIQTSAPDDLVYLSQRVRDQLLCTNWGEINRLDCSHVLVLSPIKGPSFDKWMNELRGQLAATMSDTDLVALATGDDAPAIRLAAVNRLCGKPDKHPEVFDHCINDSDIRVVLRVAKVLGPAAERPLIIAFESSDLNSRRAILRQLLAFGTSTSLEFVRNQAGQKAEQALACYAMGLLVRAGLPVDIDLCLKQLSRSRRVTDRKAWLRLLSKLKYESMVPLLENVIKNDRSFRGRAWAAERYTRLRGRDGLEFVLKALDGEKNETMKRILMNARDEMRNMPAAEVGLISVAGEAGMISVAEDRGELSLQKTVQRRKKPANS